ncbi:MAG: peroxiredoxin [Actinobacteria bacterium]|nr:MAG: peroxiredoxin [Actinomycetota bacterium]
MTAEVGKAAPDFTLKDQAGNDVTLSSFKGKSSVALHFYPFTFTAVCEGELCRIRDDYSDFEQAGVQVLAVSCDSRHSQRVWAEQQGFTFPVLSDFWPHGAVAKEYGVFNEQLGCAIRATFLIDKSGTIIDKFSTDSLGTARDPERYAASLAKL